MMRENQVIIVEDDDAFRQSLTQLVNCSRTHSVVGAFKDMDNAVRRVNELTRPLLLLDVHLGGRNSTDRVRDIKRSNPYVKVIMLSNDPSFNNMARAFSEGADGYLLKEEAVLRLGEYLDDLERHDHIASPTVLSAIINHLNSTALWARASVTEEVAKIPNLTRAQRAVLNELMLSGDYRTIGERLGIAKNTVGQHVQKVYRAYAVNSRIDLILKIQGR
jgi:DNA-binding NarL/FixJ family response regulator